MNQTSQAIASQIPQSQPNSSTIIPKSTALSQQMLTIMAFIELRQSNKNSLSKKTQPNQNPTQKNIENPENRQAFLQLIQQLMDNIAEGHTILLRESLDLAQLVAWQMASWVHLLADNRAKADITEYGQNDFNATVIDKPIVIQPLAGQGYAIWLHRQWFAERQLATQLVQISQRIVPDLTPKAIQNSGQNDEKNTEQDSIISQEANTEQRQAIDNACRYALSIITGGPGTGKTYTVAQLVKALNYAHQQQKQQNPHLPPLSIALTAPTGKAAQRMQASLLKSLDDEPIALDNAKTLHRLLGIGTNGMPRYHKNNPLPDDLIVVDEASMLGLELASLLVDAIKPTGRLILLGDAYQLAAVDAGAVLADLCDMPTLQSYRTQLVSSQRFGDNSAIGQLAQAIKLPMSTKSEKQKKLNTIHHLFTHAIPLENTKDEPALQFFPIDEMAEEKLYERLAEPYQAFFDWTKTWLKHSTHNQVAKKMPNVEMQAHIQNNLKNFVGSAEAAALFRSFDDYRILSAGHHGEFGVTAINRVLSRLHKTQLKLPRSDSPFYHGQPIMIQKNDYQLGLFNGDIGICLQIMSEAGSPQLMACFPEKVIDVSRLSLDSVVTAYALTIHKSQGSEFRQVAVCLDPVHERLLSQELIYTAVTRSKERLMLFSQPKTLDTAVLKKGNRQTGLTLQFSEK